jgi:hypothetical protein
MYTAIVLIILFKRQSVFLFGLFQSKLDNRLSSREHNKYNCCIHKILPPDYGPRYARNLYSLMKCTKNKFCIKLDFLYKIVSR